MKTCAVQIVSGHVVACRGAQNVDEGSIAVEIAKNMIGRLVGTLPNANFSVTS